MVYFKVSNSILSGAAMMVYSFANHFTPLWRRGHINPRQGISGTFEGILTPEGILTYTKEYEGILPLFSIFSLVELWRNATLKNSDVELRADVELGGTL